MKNNETRSGRKSFRKPVKIRFHAGKPPLGPCLQSAAGRRAFFLFVLSFFVVSFIFFLMPARAGLLDIKEITSPGGITAWLVEDQNVPVISMQFAFKNAGSKNENLQTQGLARLVSNTMDEGAGDLDSKAFQKELQDLSITLFFNSSRDDYSGNLKTLTRNKNRAFELLKLALNQPRFDKEPVERMIAANRSRVRSSLADPRWIAARISNDMTYEGHPYALNSGGTLSTLPKLTPDMLHDFARTHLTQERLHVVVAGDITAEELSPLLDYIFGGLPKKAPPLKVKNLKLQNQDTMAVYEKNIPQTIIHISQTSVARDDPDYHTAQIMNFTLGGSGFGSRLMEEIREKEGLTYGIYTSLKTLDHADLLTVSTSTANENVPRMLGMIKSEWKKMAEKGITEKELADAKSYLIGSLPLSMTSTDKIAGVLLSIKREGFGTDYLDRREKNIQNTTLEDVKRVANELLDPAKFTTVLVGKPEDIEPTHHVDTIPNAE